MQNVNSPKGQTLLLLRSSSNSNFLRYFFGSSEEHQWQIQRGGNVLLLVCITRNVICIKSSYKAKFICSLDYACENLRLEAGSTNNQIKLKRFVEKISSTAANSQIQKGALQ
jgi:hypothetical protein